MKIKMTYEKSIGNRGVICFIFGKHLNSFLYNWYASDKENAGGNLKFKSFMRRMKCC
jgi:hypothetical protein